jgi:hypothetical protein
MRRPPLWTAGRSEMIEIMVLLYAAALICSLLYTRLPDVLGGATLPVFALVAVILTTMGAGHGIPLILHLGIATIAAPLVLVVYGVLAFMYKWE